jgi:hypothetical protein
MILFIKNFQSQRGINLGFGLIALFIISQNLIVFFGDHITERLYHFLANFTKSQLWIKCSQHDFALLTRGVIIETPTARKKRKRKERIDQSELEQI